MSKQTDYLRWEVDNRKKGYFMGEGSFLDALETAIGDVDKYMMELPLDADGVPIRVGDVVYSLTFGGEYEVLGVGDGVFFAKNKKGELAIIASELYVHYARTLEDVLEDYLADAFAAQAMFVAESMDSDEYDSTIEELVRKTAEEIRGGCMGRDEMTRVLRRMVDTLPDVETDICTEIDRAVDEIAGRMW